MPNKDFLTRQILKKLEELMKNGELLEYWRTLNVGEDKGMKEIQQKQVDNLSFSRLLLSKDLHEMLVIRALEEELKDILAALDYWYNLDVREDEKAVKDLREKAIQRLEGARDIVVEKLRGMEFWV